MDSVSLKREISSSILAGFISASICNPLEVLRNRVIVSYSPTSKLVETIIPKKLRNAIQNVYSNEGILGFWKGYRINAISYPIFYGFFFPAYEFTKKGLKNKGFSKHGAVVISSITTGLMSDIITNPLWVIKTRIQTSGLYDAERQAKYSKIFSSAKIIFQEEGARGFYKGFLAQTLGLTHVLVYFPLYEFLKGKFHGFGSIFAASTIANSFYHDDIPAYSSSSNVRFPSSSLQNESQGRRRLRDLISIIIKEQSVRGLYSGLKYDLIRIIPSNAIVFTVYEKLRKF